MARSLFDRFFYDPLTRLFDAPSILPMERMPSRPIATTGFIEQHCAFQKQDNSFCMRRNLPKVIAEQYLVPGSPFQSDFLNILADPRAAAVSAIFIFEWSAERRAQLASALRENGEMGERALLNLQMYRFPESSFLTRAQLKVAKAQELKRVLYPLNFKIRCSEARQ